jgi:hypothetical protein
VQGIPVIDLRANCGPDCNPHIHKWADWWEARQPNALLKVTNSNYDYFYGTLDSKSRNMVRKSQAHQYTYRPYLFNAHLEEMYEIDTSKAVRSGGPMTVAYTAPQAPITYAPQCPYHSQHYIGGFDAEGKMIAYCWFVTVGHLAVLNRIIGHGDALPNGVMNGLIDYLYTYAITLVAPGYICYLSVHPTGGGLDRFKRSVGFKPTVEHISVL